MSIATYSLDDLHHAERALVYPDAEREAYEAMKYTFITRNGSVIKVPSGRNKPGPGGFTSPIPADLLYKNAAAFTAVNTFTTEQGINNAGATTGPQAKLNPYYFDADPQLSIGKTLGFRARGLVSDVTATNPTFTWTLRLGASGITGPIVLGSAAITIGTSTAAVTNAIWEFEGEVSMVTVAAAGANSTLRGSGCIQSPGFAAQAAPLGGNIYALWGGAAQPGTVATFDISIVNFINFNAACSASNASNQIQLLQLFVFGWN